MVQTGFIKKLHGRIADVEIQRSTACGDNCASCGLCNGRTAIVKAANAAGAAEGDTVMIDMADKKVLGAAFLVYIVPLVLLVAGYFIGNALFKTEIGGIITGFLLMLLSFLPIVFIDRRSRQRYLPRITGIVKADA